MPIHEYKCRTCQHRFEQLIMHSTVAECPSCGGHDLERLVSLFSVDSAATRDSAMKAGRRQGLRTTREKNDAEIAYVKRHEDH